MGFSVVLRSSPRPVLVLAIGAGILIGSGATWWLFGRRLAVAIQRLTQQITELRREIDRLRLYIEERALPTDLRRNDTLEVVDDDDDVYEDAYDGPVAWVAGLHSDQVSSCGNSDDILFEDVITENCIHNAGSLFAHIDRLLDSSDDDKCTAFNELLSHEFLYGQDSNFLWRLSKATYFQSQLEGSCDKNRQKELVYQALEYAGRALRLDDSNPNVHKWYAITLGSTTDYEGPSLKIENGFKFRTHIDRAIELNPKDATSHYLLGRWCYSVYMMTWVERKMAATLFAVPPSATVDEALSHFMEACQLQVKVGDQNPNGCNSQANRLNPSRWKENLLFIAKCHLEKRDYRSGVRWLDSANTVPVCSHEDQLYQDEVSALLRQYSIYR